MEERMSEAFASDEQLTVMGKQLHVGDPAPDFRLDYLDLADLAVRTISLADSVGMVRLLNLVNSLERPVCQRVTRQWEALCAALPPEACIYTVSMDSPQMQARWQDTAGVLHQILSAHHQSSRYVPLAYQVGWTGSRNRLLSKCNGSAAEVGIFRYPHIRTVSHLL